MTQNKTLAILIFSFAVAIAGFQNCSKVNFTSKTVDSAQPAGVSATSCTQPTTDSFLQPAASSTNKVDILLVVHNTNSFEQTALSAITSGLDTFLQNLPPNADYRISTISALNSNLDSDAGKVDVVLSSGQSNIQQALNSSLQNLTRGKSHGETGLSALQGALTTQLAYNRNRGALRPAASLAVFFLANESDLCSGHIDQLDGSDEIEPCLNSTPLETSISIEKYLSTNNINSAIIGAVTPLAIDPTKKISNELEIGYGYIDLANIFHSKILIELQSAATALSQGIAVTSTLVSRVLNTRTDFQLSRTNVDPNSVVVRVGSGNKTIPANEVSLVANAIHISDASIAGMSGDNVNVTYCQFQ